MAKKTEKKWTVTRKYKNLYPPQKCVLTIIRVYIQQDNINKTGYNSHLTG